MPRRFYLFQSTMSWGSVHLITTPLSLVAHLTAASRIQITIGTARLDGIPRVLTALSLSLSLVGSSLQHTGIPCEILFIQEFCSEQLLMNLPNRRLDNFLDNFFHAIGGKPSEVIVGCASYISIWTKMSALCYKSSHCWLKREI